MASSSLPSCQLNRHRCSPAELCEARIFAENKMETTIFIIMYIMGGYYSSFHLFSFIYSNVSGYHVLLQSPIMQHTHWLHPSLTCSHLEVARVQALASDECASQILVSCLLHAKHNLTCVKATSRSCAEGSLDSVCALSLYLPAENSCDCGSFMTDLLSCDAATARMLVHQLQEDVEDLQTL